MTMKHTSNPSLQDTRRKNKALENLSLPSSAPVEKEDFSEVRKTFHEMNKKLMDEIIGYKEENARLRSLIEELIPMAEQYKKGIVGLSDRAAYRTGEVISRARSLLTAGDKATDPDHNKPDL
jgi:hypothetical protein